MTVQEKNVSNRNSLLALLESQMKRTYSQISELGQVKENENYVKTYLLEFNTPNVDYTTIDRNLLTQKLTIPSHRKGVEGKSPLIEETEDDGFYIAKWGDGKGGDTTLYLDTLLDSEDPKNRRFWTAYSISKASSADKIVKNLASRATPIDRVWLWPKMLSEITELGQTRSINLLYDQTYFDQDESSQESRKQAKVVFKDEGLLLWHELKKSSGLGPAAIRIRDKLVESKIGITYRGESENSRKLFAIEDINLEGKFTTKGTSIGLHQELVLWVKNAYQKKIREIEKKHTIFELDGEALYFVIENGIGDVDFFCERAFSGGHPFYVWGVPERLLPGQKGRVVNAVDIHTGSEIFFQVYEDLISLSLRPGACGNSVIRFFINLQQIYGNYVSAETSDGQPIF